MPTVQPQKAQKAQNQENLFEPFVLSVAKKSFKAKLLFHLEAPGR